MANYYLINALEVYVVNLGAETAATTTGGGSAEKRNSKSGKSTYKKSKFSNNDDSASNSSKPKPNTKPKMTSCPALALESDSAIGPVPLLALTTATPSVEGLFPTTNTTTLTTAASAASAASAATAKIPFSVPLHFAAAVPSLLFSEDVMRGEGGVLRDMEAGTISLI